MAFVVTCPSCKARLKTPDLVAAGTLVACPKCSNQFTLREDSPELIEKAAQPTKAPKTAKVEEEPFEAADIDEDEKPIKSKRKKSRAEDEDDEVDERPRSKKKRVIDEDDAEEDAPKRRKRRDDDEDDEFPTSRSKSRKKKSPLVLILAISLPLLFLICGGGGYGIYSLFYSSGGPSNDMLVWAPTNSDSISGMNFSKIRNFGAIRTSVVTQAGKLTNVGLSEDNIDELMFARVGANEVRVARTKKIIDLDALLMSSRSTEKSVGTKKFYIGPFGCFHIPSPRILVHCDGENTMNELLNKDPKVTISADLKTLVSKSTGDVWGAKTNKTAPLPGMFVANYMSQYGGIRISENQANWEQNWVFSDEEKAKKTESELQTIVSLFKAGKRANSVESFDISRSGLTLTITAKGPLEGGALTIFGGF